MELHSCINYLLSVAQNTVFQHLNEQLSEYCITPAQYGVLNCLWSHNCLSPKQIGEMLRLEASSISTILDRMQKNDLIVRDIDPNNRRAILVSATKMAIEMQKPVEKIIEAMNAFFLDSLSEDERTVLLKALNAIIDKHPKNRPLDTSESDRRIT